MEQIRHNMTQHLRDRPYDTESLGVSHRPGNTNRHRDRREQGMDLAAIQRPALVGDLIMPHP